MTSDKLDNLQKRLKSLTSAVECESELKTAKTEQMALALHSCYKSNKTDYKQKFSKLNDFMAQVTHTVTLQ